MCYLCCHHGNLVNLLTLTMNCHVKVHAEQFEHSHGQLRQLMHHGLRCGQCAVCLCTFTGFCQSSAPQGFVEYLGVELGDIFDTAGLLPADFFDEDDDDEDNYYDSNHHDHRHRHGRHHGHHHGEGGGSSMRDSAAVMMFQPKRLRALKRRYDQLQRIALQVTHQSTKGMLPLLC